MILIYEKMESLEVVGRVNEYSGSDDRDFMHFQK